ncbi:MULTISPECIES: sugar ABC transporter ATP-binding protein [unclassified Mesorhizobium]|uniref:sugar ABC transporter ATP-binding protein n=1 Tax=unclassified Mesorhizobium TaxID=325217 RepID=UPI000FCCBF29|nr:MULTISPECIES: sugar ABC transporter ATP-binding protein [unclassified Mesorhizobium]RUZ89521.1 sugar ABC transporter ATP-binding protein [Mesorhizobium sp. M7A.F.Ca.US.003.02.2.1]RUY99027.1 sugar ABC transporter ATP-binding protein [Mesorhizobium sp. M7A.F.Ca.CA.001.12.2.1]RUZ22172.1 sugar ABC transporter ATP-binding protein [Mesorhizobium sp. M7A.F.Ca.US.007.01.2.1]RUZ44459.1 sugar ABC transporter ATP-binding protein [Mesorhizobium sp. M7A.F.Ca.US.003.02.1.1]RUZ69473.1 sugar ABC transporte
MSPRLQFQGISKLFPAVRALDGVSFSVGAGEIHGLLGENGAGKSTLLRILSGVHTPTAGSVLIDGKPVTLANPVAARAAGVAMIHQELQQVPRLSVAQNMFLGHPLTRGAIFVARREQERRAAEALAAIDPSIDPAAPLGTLKVAQRQIVEIARALLDRARIVAMDEPTSSLTPSEFERLAQVVTGLARDGVAVVYVSHKLDEVFGICRRATIMRDGVVVDSVDLNDLSEKAVVAMMVGRELAQEQHNSHATNKVMLSARGLSSATKVRNVSFDLHRGEVLGIAGLVGSGRTELLRLLAGADRATAGTIAIDGKAARFFSPRDAIAAGVGLVPEERKREGIVPLRSITSNMALASMAVFAPRGLIDHARLKQVAAEKMSRVNLRPFLLDRPIRLFSGGNQQKAIIGRWLAAGTRILLFDEPTRGIDVGAKAEIYHLIEELAAEGHAVVVVSSELPEVIRLADRVLVMRDGTIAAELDRANLSEQAIAAHAIPQTQTPAAQPARQ